MIINGEHPASLQYYPEGDDFVCVNGKNRYTRALYGSWSPFRLETSDRPVFATYDKRNSKNIRFRISMPGGYSAMLDSVGYCESPLYARAPELSSH